ncbi:hypothetical protein SAMN04487898_112113 [Pedobacter sp. ok626]|uniref:hypothetical protein n=1 Tax=Pedobacter sp. ok626 TaxID=1761882 RepID=UPI00088E5501|nr:hypothetical protein [Pedobacter sp. ok626]SDK84348.1 hypothetical protein SAMN04487898_112113 [Pedobacter sp. ok626]
MKNVEDYVRKNKADFDVEMPSDKLWGRIEVRLNQQKINSNRKFPFWLRIAASILLVGGLAYLFKFYSGNSRSELSAVNSGYKKEEMKFASLIEEKKDSLLIYAKDNPDLYKKFSEDLDGLDKDYERLKKELQHSPDRRLVVKAMAQNLETQLQIVSQQLSVISQVDNYRRENQI